MIEQYHPYDFIFPKKTPFVLYIYTTSTQIQAQIIVGVYTKLSQRTLLSLGFGSKALEISLHDVKAAELLDDRHRRRHVHLERQRRASGAGELLPGRPDRLPHRAVHRRRQQQRRLTGRFGGEDALVIAGAVDELDVELLGDGVHGGDLVRPRAVVDDQPIGVGRVLLVREEADPLHECAFHLAQVHSRIQALPTVVHEVAPQDGGFSRQHIDFHLECSCADFGWTMH